MRFGERGEVECTVDRRVSEDVRHASATRRMHLDHCDVELGWAFRRHQLCLSMFTADVSSNFIASSSSSTLVPNYPLS